MASLCLFCASPCPVKFIQNDGRLIVLKKEGDCPDNSLSQLTENGNKELEGDETEGGGDARANTELRVIKESLKSIFILRNLLNYPRDKLGKFLGSFDGQLHPELWLSICSQCNVAVEKCLEIHDLILSLERKLNAGREKIKLNILHSQNTAEIHTFENDSLKEIWNFVRSHVVSEFTKEDVGQKVEVKSNSTYTTRKRRISSKLQVSTINKDKDTFDDEDLNPESYEDPQGLSDSDWTPEATHSPDNHSICSDDGIDINENEKASDPRKKSDPEDDQLRTMQCQYCPFKSSASHTMLRHKRKQHPKLFFKYFCANCGRGFTARRFVRNHEEGCSEKNKQNGSPNANMKLKCKVKRNITNIASARKTKKRREPRISSINQATKTSDEKDVHSPAGVIDEHTNCNLESNEKNINQASSFKGDEENADGDTTKSATNCSNESVAKDDNDDQACVRFKTKQLRCRFCPFRSRSRHAVQRHHRNEHAKVYLKYRCTYCGQGFAKPSYVRNHVVDCSRRNATAKSPNQAVETSSITRENSKPSVAQVTAMNENEDTSNQDYGEEGEQFKSYQCQYCPFKSSGRHTMLRHKRKQHAEVFFKYFCTNCGRGFATLNFVSKHEVGCSIKNKLNEFGKEDNNQKVKPNSIARKNPSELNVSAIKEDIETPGADDLQAERKYNALESVDSDWTPGTPDDGNVNDHSNCSDSDDISQSATETCETKPNTLNSEQAKSVETVDPKRISRRNPTKSKMKRITPNTSSSVNKKARPNELIRPSSPPSDEYTKRPLTFQELNVFPQLKRRVFRFKEYYKCNDCPAFYTRKENIESHLNIHRKNIGTPCQLCGWLIRKTQHYNELHMKKHYPNLDCDAQKRRTQPKSKVTKCPLCGALSSNRAWLADHLNLHKTGGGSNCPDCSWLLEETPHSVHNHKNMCPKNPSEIWKSLYENNLLVYLNPNQIHTDDAPYYCDHCPFMTIHIYKIDKHFETVHESQSSCKCDQCETSFVSKQLLQIHSRDVHQIAMPDPEVGSFACTHCPEIFDLKRKLDFHTWKCHRSRIYDCTVCGYQAGTTFFLKEHMQKHTGVNLYACDLCDQSFKGRFGLTQHKRTLHPNDCGLQPIICPDCGLTFGSTGLLNKHLKRVHQGFTVVCDHCGKTFDRPAGLEKHIKVVHSSTSKHTAKNFSFDSGFYVCDKCGEKFKRIISVKVHMKNVHGDTFEYKCAGCQTLFDGPRLLANHAMTCDAANEDNGGEGMRFKTLKCEFCPFETRSKSLSLMHKRKEHAKMFLKFFCSHCGKGFTKQSYVDKHEVGCSMKS